MTAVVELATGTGDDDSAVDDGSFTALNDSSGEQVDGAVADVGRSADSGRPFADVGHKLQLIVRLSVRQDRVPGNGGIERIVGAFVGVLAGVVPSVPAEKHPAQEYDRAETDHNSNYVRCPNESIKLVSKETKTKN